MWPRLDSGEKKTRLLALQDVSNKDSKQKSKCLLLGKLS